MYGLFFNTYDCYEWHDIVCVSSSRGDLVAYWENLGKKYPLLEGEDQKQAEHREIYHYVIEPVEVV